MNRPFYLQKLSGVFAVYKPKGITSAEMCNKIRDIIHSELGDVSFGSARLKIGHGGVLDKHAEGVLAVGLEGGCKHLPWLLHGNKAYICKARFGQTTDTYYEDGTVTETQEYDHIQRENLEKCLNERFLGSILQKPPVYSALKHGGERLSDLAASGREIPAHKLSPRSVVTHSVVCSQFSLPHFSIEVECGGGFYVRSLIHDIGKALGSCAVVTDLKRTQHGAFHVKDTLTLHQCSLDNILTAMQHGPNAKQSKYARNKHRHR